MFDILQFIFWSITYFTVDLQILKSRHSAPQFIFPRVANMLDYSWEFVALLRDILGHCFGLSLLIHIVWFTFDTLIVYNSVVSLKQNYRKLFLFLFLPVIFGLYVWFKAENGMLLSVFIIDVIMAVDFIVCAAKLQNANIYGIIIAVSKLIGDLFAWLFYRSQHPAVYYMGVAVLVCNSLYLVIVLYRFFKEKQPTVKQQPVVEKRKQTVTQKKYSKGWQSTKKKYKKKK